MMKRNPCLYVATRVLSNFLHPEWMETLRFPWSYPLPVRSPAFPLASGSHINVLGPAAFSPGVWDQGSTMESIILDHWAVLAQCIVLDKPVSATLTAVALSRWPNNPVLPQRHWLPCPALVKWTRGETAVTLPWGRQGGAALLAAELNCSRQESANQRLSCAKNPSMQSCLRTVWQGRVNRANHGGWLQHQHCGAPNTLGAAPTLALGPARLRRTHVRV